MNAEISDYDSPWKEALEMYFPQFMDLLFSEAYAEIDWALPHEFLDKELQQVVRDAESGRKHTDKLVKVYTLDGTETWVLIHVEIQGKADRYFNIRMYRYHYRLQDRYPDRRIASFAVLTRQHSAAAIGYYQQNLWGTQVRFDFPVIRLQDWNNKLEELANNPNPFAVVILAQLIAHRTTGDDLTRKNSKFQLIRLLYQRGYQRQDVLELLRCIDWMLQLPPELEIELAQDITRLEEEQTMSYVMAIERYAEARGEVRGEVRGEAKTLLKLFKLKFGVMPEWVEDKVYAADQAQLDSWVEHILTAESMEQLFSSC